MIEVIVNTLDETPKKYVDTCIKSVREAISLSPYHVKMSAVPGIPWDLGRTRYKSIKQATEKYILFVDCDDFVLPNIFRSIVPHIHRDFDAIYARELRLCLNNTIEFRQDRHHPAVYRRECILNDKVQDIGPFGDKPVFDSLVTTTIDELSWVYVYRLWDSTVRRQRGELNGKAYTP